MTLTKEKEPKQPTEIQAPADTEMRDYLANSLVLSQLLAGIIRSSALLGAQIKQMITDVAPTEQISILRAARRAFEQLSDKASEVLTQHVITERDISEFIVTAQSIHRTKLEEPTRKCSQLRPLSSTVKYIIYKAANMVRCSCFFTSHHQYERSRMIGALVKDTKEAITINQGSNQPKEGGVVLS